MKEMIPKLYDSLEPVMRLGLTLLTLYLSAWIRTHIGNERVKSILLRFNDAVEDVVRMMAATVVPEIRAALADGVITQEEGDKIKAIAVAEIKTFLGADFISTMEKVFGKDEVLAMIDAKIEAMVQKIKNEGK